MEEISYSNLRVPTPSGRPWLEQGLLEPLWSRGPILPLSMVDILEKQDDVDENDEEDGVDDYEELLAFLDEDDE